MLPVTKPEAPAMIPIPPAHVSVADVALHQGRHALSLRSPDRNARVPVVVDDVVENVATHAIRPHSRGSKATNVFVHLLRTLAGMVLPPFRVVVLAAPHHREAIQRAPFRHRNPGPLRILPATQVDDRFLGSKQSPPSPLVVPHATNRDSGLQAELFLVGPRRDEHPIPRLGGINSRLDRPVLRRNLQDFGLQTTREDHHGPKNVT